MASIFTPEQREKVLKEMKNCFLTVVNTGTVPGKIYVRDPLRGVVQRP